ncbi:DUF4013 domain-containing protein [Halorarum salinum]|uniref:DUF4013 domain-containing protein n=1 Tax=Halorarum salinum TaxID=2743089 RepID=A0A7D5LBH3_9EURY|nr:DUF4013 domain-containing protein [Halobaculum salinum]QLG62574.1 DUF4013 domain-containing protein [Halobaculum salinum]
MLREALRFPLRGDRGDVLETLAIGGGLHLLAAYLPLVPLVPVVGYLVGVLRDGSDGDPPLFRDPRRLLRDGVLGSVVCVAYLLPPLALLLVTVGRAAIEGVPADVPSGVFVVASTLSLLSAAAVAYLLPAALVGLSREGLRAAFAPRELLSTAANGRYFYAWVVGGATLGTAAALSPGLNRVALGFFVLFYAEVVAAAAWAAAVGGNRFTSAP